MHHLLADAFDRLVLRDPTARVAVQSGGRTLDRASLDALARAAGRALPPCDPGTVVALRAVNGPGFLAAFLALHRHGAVPLLLDASTTVADTEAIARAFGAGAVFGTAESWPSATDFHLTQLDGPQTPLAAVAAVKVTSGSTSAPRGVACSAAALLADEAALASTMGIRDDERIVAAIPLAHSYGFASVVLPALVRGCVLVFPDGGPLGPLAAATEHQATFFPTLPAFVRAALRVARPPAWPASLRLVISAGAPLPAEVAAQFRDTQGRHVHVFYGASECGGICYDREGGAAERQTVGSAVDGVTVSLDAGRVSVRSPAVGEGYVPLPDPRLAGGRFETSDLAEWRAGELALLGRGDAVINVKGRKVDPGEIEAVLLQMAGVEEVVALGIPAPDHGSDLVRVVIACQPGRLTYGDVVDWCRGRLADHKLPRSILLVPQIPRTARGKIDRAALSGPARE